MNNSTRNFLQILAGATVCLLGMHSAWAQDADHTRMQMDGPARWYQEDMTPRAHFQTSKKEIGAAYQEAMADCRKAEHASRAACMREAGTQFEQDMAAARQQHHVVRR